MNFLVTGGVVYAKMADGKEIIVALQAMCPAVDAGNHQIVLGVGGGII